MSKGLEKRKLASDVLDYLEDESGTETKENEVKLIPVDKLVPFHNHPFKLYEGQRLDDMVESIKEHGVMIPILARMYKGKLEILSGHNRLNASIIAGLKEVPVIEKVGLSEKEAYTYVIETNLIQRGFSELLPSEQAAALEIEYDKVISQGKRNDIIREIEKLSGIESTSGQSDQKLDKRDAISSEYGMSGSKMARMLRINHLVVILLEACSNSRDQLMLLLLSETGFRIGEILGIKYTQDIDYQKRTIRVMYREDNENDARAKNAEYRRSKISAETFDILMYYLAENRELLKDSDYLFLNLTGENTGEPENVNTVYAMLRRLEEKTGVKATPHMLRHYFANERRKSGWDLALISKALGHKNISTTEAYLNIDADELSQATDEYYSKNKSLFMVDKLI